MPSLPSLPPFEDSLDLEDESQGPAQGEEEEAIEFTRMTSPLQSTPTIQQYTITSSQRGSTTTTNSNNSTARFAHSIASRSNKSSSLMIKKNQNDSFDAPSLPLIHSTVIGQDSDEEGVDSRSSVPDIYLPPEGDSEQQEPPDISLADALESISKEESPLLPELFHEATTKDYDSVSLNSELKVSFPLVIEIYCLYL